MTLRPEVVHERLDKLRQTVRKLQDVADSSPEEFVRDFRLQWFAERGLQIAAEALLDTGNHLLVGRFNVRPSDYEDVVRKLGERGILSAALATRLRGLGGFRNILVHGTSRSTPPGSTST